MSRCWRMDQWRATRAGLRLTSLAPGQAAVGRLLAAPALAAAVRATPVLAAAVLAVAVLGAPVPAAQAPAAGVVLAVAVLAVAVLAAAVLAAAVLAVAVLAAAVRATPVLAAAVLAAAARATPVPAAVRPREGEPAEAPGQTMPAQLASVAAELVRTEPAETMRPATVGRGVRQLAPANRVRLARVRLARVRLARVQLVRQLLAGVRLRGALSGVAGRTVWPARAREQAAQVITDGPADLRRAAVGLAAGGQVVMTGSAAIRTPAGVDRVRSEVRAVRGGAGQAGRVRRTPEKGNVASGQPAATARPAAAGPETGPARVSPGLPAVGQTMSSALARRAAHTTGAIRSAEGDQRRRGSAGRQGSAGRAEIVDQQTSAGRLGIVDQQGSVDRQGSASLRATAGLGAASMSPTNGTWQSRTALLLTS
jgi:hypothetical protein